ncbi:hypothetical protein D9757_000679 [Collybiopsis confluens]|uniref:Ribosomal RNA-processing protein 17 n=1 Tax=Collybiopsis confluens TaxID=2823264 RepID=A0A8H5I1U6_9AGAR|nr:hypothetical protein D9757_000679 [Collybiopsis confluens]
MNRSAILFDDAARHEFLTGFHKRKLAKKEAAKKKAIERDKQQRQQERREQRQMLRERAAQNAAEVEKAYGAAASEEWHGVIDNQPEEEQYEDEDVLATVAIVEDFDPDTLLHGPSRPAVSNLEPAEEKKQKKQKKTIESEPSKRTKPKKIKYQTKAARKSERVKQHARRTEKAELAGGRASRRKHRK